MNEFLRFIIGLFLGAGWTLANYFLTLKVLKIAILKQSKAQLSLLLLVKFPVLYLLGFLILIVRLFPIISLLLGSGLALLAAGVINLWPKRKQ